MSINISVNDINAQIEKHEQALLRLKDLNYGRVVVSHTESDLNEMIVLLNEVKAYRQEREKKDV